MSRVTTLYLHPVRPETLLENFFDTPIPMECFPGNIESIQVIISTNAENVRFDNGRKNEKNQVEYLALDEIAEDEEFIAFRYSLKEFRVLEITELMFIVKGTWLNKSSNRHDSYNFFLNYGHENPEDLGNSCIAKFSYYKDNASDGNPIPPEFFNAAFLLSLLYDKFDLISRPALLRSLLDEESKAILNAREATTSALQSEVAKLGEHLASSAQKNDEHLRKLKTELQEQHASERKALHEDARTEREKSLNEISIKQNKLDKERQKFEEEKRNHDFRENTYVRRELLGKIRDEIIDGHKELGLSKETARKRILVHVFCGLVMLLTIAYIGCYIALAIWGLSATNRSPDEVLLKLAIPLVPSSLLFISTLIFYLRWCNAWFREHADWETAKRKFAEDMYRASWVAELFFEWRRPHKEGGVENKVPEEFSHFTRGLFESNNKSADTKHHPLDDIISLTTKFKRVKASKTGVELERGEDKS